MAIWRIFRRSPLSEEKYPNRNPAWKQALLIIDFQGNTRKGSSTSLSASIKGNVPPNKNGRKIELYTETYNVETMTYVAFHEMQHSVQGRVSGLLSALDVYSAETLATGVETFLTRKYYPDYENLTVISATPGATGVEIMTGGYTGLVQDLVDNDNSQEDYCNGFELDKIEADFHSSSPVTWNNWRDEIIANRSTNPTVNKVSDLFAAWKM